MALLAGCVWLPRQDGSLVGANGPPGWLGMVTKTGWKLGGGLETGLMALLAVYGNQGMI